MLRTPKWCRFPPRRAGPASRNHPFRNLPPPGAKPPAWRPASISSRVAAPAATSTAPVAWQQPPQAGYSPPPPHAAYPPQYAQQPAAGWQPPPAVQRKAPPTWLLGLGFAVIFVIVLGGVYYGIQHFGVSAAEKAGLENPSNPSRQKVTNPLQKYVEVTGIRMMTENKKPVAKFVVVNHSTADIADLQASVTLWASTSRSEEDYGRLLRLPIPNLAAGELTELAGPAQDEAEDV